MFTYGSLSPPGDGTHPTTSRPASGGQRFGPVLQAYEPVSLWNGFPPRFSAWREPGPRSNRNGFRPTRATPVPKTFTHTMSKQTSTTRE